MVINNLNSGILKIRYENKCKKWYKNKNIGIWNVKSIFKLPNGTSTVKGKASINFLQKGMEWNCFGTTYSYIMSLTLSKF